MLCVASDNLSTNILVEAPRVEGAAIYHGIEAEDQECADTRKAWTRALVLRGMQLVIRGFGDIAAGRPWMTSPIEEAVAALPVWPPNGPSPGRDYALS